MIVEIIATSHSSMGTFKTCPRQYEAKYITKDVEFTSGPEAEWGSDVHDALEHYVRDGTPLPSNMAHYTRFAEAMRRRPGEKILEGAFAVNKDLQPVDFSSPDVWWRAKIDVLIRRSNTKAEVHDWKTGRIKNDPAQLRLYACLVFFHYPEIEEIKAGYVWLKEGVVTAPIPYRRESLERYWQPIVAEYEQLAAAKELGVFQPKPSGLCNGWCPVERCEFWKPKPPGRR